MRSDTCHEAADPEMTHRCAVLNSWTPNTDKKIAILMHVLLKN